MGEGKLHALGAVDIAGFVFGLHANYPKPILWIQEGFPAFFSRRKPSHNIFIRYQRRWPKGLPLRVSDEPKIRWSGSRFTIQTAYYRAEGTLPGKKVEAVIAPGFSGSGLIRTLLALFLLRSGGFLLHAAGVTDGEKAYVFSGPTQSGKTTIAAHLANGHAVLNDETIAVRRTRTGYMAYSTPFPGEMKAVSVNRGARMDSLFFIRKGTEFERRPLSPSEVVAYALPQLICLERTPEGAKEALKALTTFAQKVPCYDFSFRPTMELWSHLS